MTKRTAIALAGGLVAAMVAGLAAMSVNFGILRASEKVDGPGRLEAAKPIIRTEVVRETVKVRKHGKAKVVVTTAGSPSSGVSGSSLASTGGGHGDETVGSEGHESEEHESEDHESEDQGAEHEFDEHDDD